MLATIENTQLEELATATQAANHFGITTQAINNWVRRRYLAVAGHDEYGRRLYRRDDLEQVNKATTQRALRNRPVPPNIAKELFGTGG